MHVSDNLYLGGFGPAGMTLGDTSSDDPTLNQGIGAAGRVFHLTIVPAAVSAVNLAAAQHTVAATALALAAGAGITAVANFQGSGLTAYALDVPRCVSLTSAANLSAMTFTLVGYDYLGRLTTSTIAGPNINTVTFPKAVKWVVSITPSATDGVNNVSAGMSDKFGLPWAITDAGQILSNKWANSLTQDAGTLVTADTTAPATAATGDPRGTYQPASASDGVKRLVIAAHLFATQCGAQATQAAAIGVAPV